MTLASGRSFNESFTTDQQLCLLNESAVKNYNITDLEKTRIIHADPSGPEYIHIIGVVKNFNYESLPNPIQPYIFKLANTDAFLWGYLYVKISSLNYSKTISEIEKVWKEYTAARVNPVQSLKYE
jgi:putative ABC transport system permease protein